MSAVLFWPVTLLKAMQMYFPLIFKVSGPIINTDVVATRELLKYQLIWLGGWETLEQLSILYVPASAVDGPVITGFIGPSFNIRELRKKGVICQNFCSIT